MLTFLILIGVPVRTAAPIAAAIYYAVAALLLWGALE